MEKNSVQAKEIRNLKIEKESQAILLCEVTEQKKKSMEDKAMTEHIGREVNRANQYFQHEIGYSKSNDEC